MKKSYLVFHKTPGYFLLLLFISLSQVGFSQIDFKESFYSIVPSPDAVDVGDINNDGLDDIVISLGFLGTPNDNSLLVYLQDSTGQWGDSAIYNIGWTTSTMAIADMNNNGLNDVIVGVGRDIGILYQKTDGTLMPMTQYACNSEVLNIATGDLNSDGLTDVAVTTFRDSIKLFYQSSQGFSTITYSSPSRCQDLHIGDLNQDGKDDVMIIASWPNISLYTYYQGSQGINPNSVHDSLPASRSYSGNFVIADLNNDGANDVATTISGNTPNSKLVLLFQDTVSHRFNQSLVLDAFDIPSDIIVEDFDCDNKPEIVIMHSAWFAFTVYNPDSAGNYSGYQRFRHPHSLRNQQAMVAGNLSDDNMLDIAAIGGSSQFRIYDNRSLPDTFSYEDTAFVIRTSVESTRLDSIFSVSYYYDTVGTMIIIERDSIVMQRSNVTERVQEDSFLVRYGTLCQSLATDSTSFSQNVYRRTVSYIIDTVFRTSFFDTTFLVNIEARLTQEGFYFYPNPTKDLLTIHIPCEQGCNMLEVGVFDLHGKQLMLKSVKYDSDDGGKLEVGILPVGVYMLRVMSRDGAIYGKFQKN